MADEVGIEPTTNRLTADRSTAELLIKNMEPTLGFEPRTDGLQNRCSTTELHRREWLRRWDSNPVCVLMRHTRPPGLAHRDMKVFMPIRLCCHLFLFLLDDQLKNFFYFYLIFFVLVCFSHGQCIEKVFLIKEVFSNSVLCRCRPLLQYRDV